MGVPEVVALVLTAGAVLYAVSLYNGLVRLKHNVSRSWSDIDVLLVQRHDELPKLVETCKQYMKYEQDTLEKVMKARSDVAAARQGHDVAALGKAEAAMRQGLGGLFALAEAYPELKANQTFLHLQTRISGLEGAIADRRERYNEGVNLNNARLEQFPDSILAGWFRFQPFPLLRFDESETRDVDVKALFG